MEETDLEQYIIIYYHNLLTTEEKLAYKHFITSEKAANSSEKFGKMMMKKWGTTNPKALELYDRGYFEFKKGVASRILKETPEKVFINNCSNCGKLARTPLAKQCRFCGNRWH